LKVRVDFAGLIIVLYHL